MKMNPTNTAAWLQSRNASPLTIDEAHYTSPAAGEIVIKNHAVAINPVDWAIQRMGKVVMSHLQYPLIPGADCAGQVIEVGPGVSRFKVGDRVLGSVVGALPGHTQHNSEAAFQHYVVLREDLAAPIPDAMKFEEASVIPLGLMTAAFGLFHKDYLALDPLTTPPRLKRTRKALIITGGASSVGSCAIQLAVAAGYEVYSTSSPKNFAYVKSLGASHVFDYHRPTLSADMIAALKNKRLAGAYAIGDGSVEASIRVLRACNSEKKFVAFSGSAPPEKATRGGLAFAGFVLGFLWGNLRRQVMSLALGVPHRFIDIRAGELDVVEAVHRDFLPGALESRVFVPAPPPRVVGKGLEAIQEAMDLQIKGVSAQKIVVSL